MMKRDISLFQRLVIRRPKVRYSECAIILVIPKAYIRVRFRGLGLGLMVRVRIRLGLGSGLGFGITNFMFYSE